MASLQGYSNLRENQLNGVIQGNDVFIILLKGSGKSLCYAILLFAFDELRGCEGSLAIVVSPLIALMKDQVCNL